MKKKIIRILKYLGLGVGGLFVLIIILGIALPEPQDAEDTITEPQIVDEEIKVEEIIVEEPEQEDVIVETPPKAQESPEPVPEKVPQVLENPIGEEPEEPVITDTGEKWYTSSHYSAQYYYPEDCSYWEELSPSYHKDARKQRQNI